MSRLTVSDHPPRSYSAVSSSQSRWHFDDKAAEASNAQLQTHRPQQQHERATTTRQLHRLDPRGFKTDLTHRHARKELEKSCEGFQWSEFFQVALTGVVALIGVEKIIEAKEKHSEREHQRERDRYNRRRPRRHRDVSDHDDDVSSIADSDDDDRGRRRPRRPSRGARSATRSRNRGRNYRFDSGTDGDGRGARSIPRSSSRGRSYRYDDGSDSDLAGGDDGDSNNTSSFSGSERNEAEDRRLMEVLRKPRQVRGKDARPFHDDDNDNDNNENDDDDGDYDSKNRNYVIEKRQSRRRS